MIKSLCRLAGIATLALGLGSISSVAAESPVGTWYDQSGEGAVEISDCNGKLCGRVVWVKSAKNAATCNVAILGNLAPTKKGNWDSGWIYDPESHRKFDVQLTPLADGTLKVRGYLGTIALGRTMIWTRAATGLNSCNTPQTEVAQAPPHAAPPAADVAPPPVATPTEPALRSVAESGQVPNIVSPPVATSTLKAKPARTASEQKRPARSGKTIRLASLGFDDIKLRKSRGACHLSIPAVGRVAFPC